MGASLGSFSVSAQVVELLNDEFGAELAAKKGKLDTDPGLWMPLTLDQGAPFNLDEFGRIMLRFTLLR